ncbi:MAG: type II toxin-antitoxin system VapC family toxin [Thermoplasmatales archaeon]|nr:type II toxin-antitoxin system VapC family toxin [Thermoplasmatales archaeon]
MPCLDTDFLIALLRKEKNALEKLRDLADRNEVLSTTPINACELFKGAWLSSSPAAKIRKVTGLLAKLRLLDVPVEACEIFGRASSELIRSGQEIGDIDTLIASIAMANNELVVTKNVAHFQRVRGLLIETW